MAAFWREPGGPDTSPPGPGPAAGSLSFAAPNESNQSKGAEGNIRFDRADEPGAASPPSRVRHQGSPCHGAGMLRLAAGLICMVAGVKFGGFCYFHQIRLRLGCRDKPDSLLPVQARLNFEAFCDEKQRPGRGRPSRRWLAPVALLVVRGSFALVIRGTEARPPAPGYRSPGA